MPISQTEGYFKNLQDHFLEEQMLFCWFQNETSKKKCFLMLRQKPTQILLWNLLIFTFYLMKHIFQTSLLLIRDNTMCRT